LDSKLVVAESVLNTRSISKHVAGKEKLKGTNADLGHSREKKKEETSLEKMGRDILPNRACHGCARGDKRRGRKKRTKR